MLNWIREHFSVRSSDIPVEPVIYQVEHRSYIICTLRFFGRSWSFSVHVS